MRGTACARDTARMPHVLEIQREASTGAGERTPAVATPERAHEARPQTGAGAFGRFATGEDAIGKVCRVAGEHLSGARR